METKKNKLICLAILLLISGITGINAQQDAESLLGKSASARKEYRKIAWENKDKNLKEKQFKDILQLRKQLGSVMGNKQTVNNLLELSETERKMKKEIYYLDLIISKEKTPEEWRKLFKEYVDIGEEYLTDYFNNNDFSFRLRDKYLKRMEQLKRKIDVSIEKGKSNPELNILLSYKKFNKQFERTQCKNRLYDYCPNNIQSTSNKDHCRQFKKYTRYGR
ncbi:MAG: hypothetical protein LBS20_09625 [Prevotella sp.]|jgi:hypothetical protein|nr:hypothetical protein [Prevotella sp.]